MGLFGENGRVHELAGSVMAIVVHGALWALIDNPTSELRQAMGILFCIVGLATNAFLLYKSERNGRTRAAFCTGKLRTALMPFIFLPEIASFVLSLTVACLAVDTQSVWVCEKNSGKAALYNILYNVTIMFLHVVPIIQQLLYLLNGD
eukprot:m.225738 g.225738  ORF g.225738 m.225738 type:complete len:148 (+) comp16772_c0_seq1:165-608(+)